MFWNGLPPHTYCTLTMKRNPHSVCSRGKAACFSLRVSSPLMTFSKNIPIQYSILSTLICSALLCKIMLIPCLSLSVLQMAEHTERCMHGLGNSQTSSLLFSLPTHAQSTLFYSSNAQSCGRERISQAWIGNTAICRMNRGE